MRRLTWREAIARRLARHFLAKPAARARIADVVGGVCGIHAQVMPSAELSIGIRLRGATAADIADALWNRRVLVKTYGPRGTVHILPANELALWTAALNPAARDDSRRHELLGLKRGDIRAIVEAIGDALDGEQLTREELGAEVARRVGRWAVERRFPAFGGEWSVWQSGIGAAASAGLLCFGPNEGSRVTFVRPERWIGPQKRIDPSAALKEVARRYLFAYGPATHREFAQWLGADPTLALQTLGSLGDSIEEVDIEGTRAWQIASDRTPRAMNESVQLLPRFDCYVVGSHPRDVLIPPRIVDRAARTQLFPRRPGSVRPSLVGPTPLLVIDGIASGIWESRRTGPALTFRVQAFVRLSSRQREAVASSAERIGAIVGAQTRLSFGRVTTRPHL